jgi:hypothetical protein
MCRKRIKRPYPVAFVVRAGAAASILVLLVLTFSPIAFAFSSSASPQTTIGTGTVGARGRSPTQTPQETAITPNPRRLSTVGPLFGPETVNPYALYSSEPAPMGIADYGVSSAGGYEYATNSSLGVAYIGSLSTYCPTPTSTCTASGDSMSIQLNVVLQFVANGNTYAYWIQDVALIDTSVSGEYEPYIIDNIWNFSSPTASMTSGVSGSGQIAISGSTGWYYYESVDSLPGNDVYLALPGTMNLEVNSTLNGSQQPVVDFAYNDGYGWTTYDVVTFSGVSGLTSMKGFLVDGLQANPAGLYYDAELILGGPGGSTQTEDQGSDVRLQLEYLNGHNYQMITTAYDFGSDTAEGISNALLGAYYYSNNGSLFSDVQAGSGSLAKLYDRSQVGVVHVQTPFSSGDLEVVNDSMVSPTPSTSPFTGGLATVTIAAGTWLFKGYQGGSLYAQASQTVAGGGAYTINLSPSPVVGTYSSSSACTSGGAQTSSFAAGTDTVYGGTISTSSTAGTPWSMEYLEPGGTVARTVTNVPTSPLPSCDTTGYALPSGAPTGTWTLEIKDSSGNVIGSGTFVVASSVPDLPSGALLLVLPLAVIYILVRNFRGATAKDGPDASR